MIAWLQLSGSSPQVEAVYSSFLHRLAAHAGSGDAGSRRRGASSKPGVPRRQAVLNGLPSPRALPRTAA